MYKEAEAETDDDTEAVGGEIEPLAAAVGGGVGLQELQRAAHEDGGEYGPEEKADGTAAVGGMAPPVLMADDEGKDGVHDHVCPFVGKGHVFGDFNGTDGQ